MMSPRPAHVAQGRLKRRVELPAPALLFTCQPHLAEHRQSPGAKALPDRIAMARRDQAIGFDRCDQATIDTSEASG